MTDLGQTGPFSGPAPSGTVSVSATAVGQLFDTAVSSSVGDFMAAGVAGQTASVPFLDLGNAGKRLVAEREGHNPWASCPPGGPSVTPPQTTTIMVTITPNAPKGTKVYGHLNIGAFDSLLSNGDELISLPYAYTVQ